MHRATQKDLDITFLYIDEIRQLVLEAQQDPNTPKSGGGNGHCRISDPTAMLAIRKLEGVLCVEVPVGPEINGKRDSYTLYNPDKWIKLYEWTKSDLQGRVEWDVLTLYYTYYEDRSKRAIICKELNIGSTCYHVILNGIWRYIWGMARGLGLNFKKIF